MFLKIIIKIYELEVGYDQIEERIENFVHTDAVMNTPPYFRKQKEAISDEMRL